MKRSRWHWPSIVSAVFFSGLSAVHLIDDFLAEVPREFHLSEDFTQLLALAYMLALVGLVASASAQRRMGYLGLAIAGFLIALAQLAKSVPEMLLPGPWRAGLSSELIATWLAISALFTMVASFLAWREWNPALR